MIQSVCVFCGSSFGNDDRYRRSARTVGRLLAERGLRLIYGGGGIGLMGEVADGAREVGGQVIGVIPQALAEKELAHDSLSELHVVGSMHERKAMMAELSDAFVALPGGFGTWEELCEIITWRQLGMHAKPIGVLNEGGFYDLLLQQFDAGVSHGFISSEHRQVVIAAADPTELLDAMQSAKTKPMQKWLSDDES